MVVGIKWSEVSEKYKRTASAEGYYFDGVLLNLSEKDQK